MPQNSEELDALMKRLAEGDRSVFTRVFELLWAPTKRLCSNLLKNDADAADAAQEAMQKILERASDYDDTRPALPWALAIAGWECRTLARKRVRRREANAADLPESAGENPEPEFVQRDLMAAALAALGELSESDRETLVATFWDEAASVSGATLRKRRERAIERLRKTFKRLYGID
ncbi:MAG TPA: sigma-70 family RNA polymerase sigma factor [Polyangiaceae bacterium]|nr:sigma-70 family RNA polymerase sigma factor [Polyangiaceae bacterium]